MSVSSDYDAPEKLLELMRVETRTVFAFMRAGTCTHDLIECSMTSDGLRSGSFDFQKANMVFSIA